MYPQSVLSKNKKTICNQNFPTENFKVLQLKKNLYITWVCFRNEIHSSTYMKSSSSSFDNLLQCWYGIGLL